MTEFVEVAGLAQVPPGTGTTFTAADKTGSCSQRGRNDSRDERRLSTPWFLALHGQMKCPEAPGAGW